MLNVRYEMRISKELQAKMKTAGVKACDVREAIQKIIKEKQNDK